MSILSDMSYKGNRSLKPHQPGMAKTGEVQQGFVDSPHWRARFTPVKRSLYISVVWQLATANLWGGLVRNCSVRNGSGFVLQRSGSTLRYGDLGHVL